MPTIRRKSGTTILETRREVLHTVGWQVRPNVWSPPTDVYETEETFIVRIEIAGMREDDFEVSLESNTLFVTGFRPEVRERRAYHQMEIHFGKFATAVGIPGTVDVEHSTAEYKDGFLTVTLPKTASNP